MPWIIQKREEEKQGREHCGAKADKTGSPAAGEAWECASYFGSRIPPKFDA